MLSAAVFSEEKSSNFLNFETALPTWGLKVTRIDAEQDGNKAGRRPGRLWKGLQAPPELDYIAMPDAWTRSDTSADEFGR